jgi:hypothetical protein
LIAELLSVVVVERNAGAADLKAVDAVLERSGEHVAPEFAVCEDRKPNVALLLDDLFDVLVLQRMQSTQILGAFFGEQRGVLWCVHALEFSVELRGPQKVADMFRPGRRKT